MKTLNICFVAKFNNSFLSEPSSPKLCHLIVTLNPFYYLNFVNVGLKLYYSHL